MKMTRIVAVAVLIVGSGLALHVARAQQPGIKRTDLQRHDLSVPGREVVQVRVELDSAGVVFPKHAHPGEEIVYVVEGALEYEVDRHVPPVHAQGRRGPVHPGRNPPRGENLGSSNAAELATYIVEKGKPLVDVGQVSAQ